MALSVLANVSVFLQCLHLKQVLWYLLVSLQPVHCVNSLLAHETDLSLWCSPASARTTRSRLAERKQRAVTQ